MFTNITTKRIAQLLYEQKQKQLYGHYGGTLWHLKTFMKMAGYQL